jgi:predicted ATPase
VKREDVTPADLLGPGGIGKYPAVIELARELSAQYGSNICFVDLSAQREPQYCRRRLRMRWALDENSDVRALIHFLRPKDFLLVLDNFEHILPAAAVVTDLLAAAPGLKILITSRAALRVYGEHEYLISPLATPRAETIREPEKLAESPAVAVFVQRARAVNPTFSLTRDKRRGGVRTVPASGRYPRW